MVFAAPMVGAIAITFWLGVYALISGVLLLARAFRLKPLHEFSLAEVTGRDKSGGDSRLG